ncbi:Hypothetical protein NocV09_00802380 [Nannochloropsis oceanica]
MQKLMTQSPPSAVLEGSREAGGRDPSSCLWLQVWLIIRKTNYSQLAPGSGERHQRSAETYESYSKKEGRGRRRRGREEGEEEGDEEGVEEEGEEEEEAVEAEEEEGGKVEEEEKGKEEEGKGEEEAEAEEAEEEEGAEAVEAEEEEAEAEEAEEEEEEEEEEVIGGPSEDFVGVKPENTSCLGTAVGHVTSCGCTGIWSVGKLVPMIFGLVNRG